MRSTQSFFLQAVHRQGRTPRAGRRSTWASPQDFEQACLHCFALIRGLVVIFRPFPSPSFFLPPFNPRTITSIRAGDARKVGHRMPQGTKSVRSSPNSTMRGANISRKKNPGGMMWKKHTENDILSYTDLDVA